MFDDNSPIQSQLVLCSIYIDALQVSLYHNSNSIVSLYEEILINSIYSNARPAVIQHSTHVK